ncbi:SDR family NAD(P)-dependent oxidoreductase [Chitinophagaceae bacterium LB-8]|uniref:SDR family NAD(P)-dependent oxidoreductase n=1 Tax=Paraflavisolibacter caeni TaxID=2982496 RepID=A0A9X3BHS1_9BACT|nr:SDR family NAD(P)-dependent oxidoreductase [Paraflavisolibacter caeni]MCU7552804.1 SDR family NAD(P)-dependent oxidoreductase [Paraflavisolibacter caeni]
MRTVIITGANGNLGTAVTQTFLKKGYRVIATVSKEASKKELPAHDQLFVETVDLTNEQQTTAFVAKTIATHQKIDAALLLVGGFAMGKVAETTGTDLKKQMALNFETAYYVARPLLQHMEEQNYGRLVFIGSRPALKPADGKNMVAYAFSKSLLFQLAEFINAEMKGKDIVATVAVPSTLDTEINRKSMPQANPADWVKPEALAEILEFTCSDAASPLRETVLKVYNNA